jgi:hypothetical protein
MSDLQLFVSTTVMVVSKKSTKHQPESVRTRLIRTEATAMKEWTRQDPTESIDGNVQYLDGDETLWIVVVAVVHGR